jgi:hypothetical protein
MEFMVPVNIDTRRKTRRFRGKTRLEINLPVRAYQVLNNGAPAETPALFGTLIGLTNDHIAFKTDAATGPTAGDRLLVSIVRESDVWQHAVVVVNDVVFDANGTVIDAEFARASFDLLDATNLSPRFGVQTKTITTPIPNRVLDRWVELGVLRQSLVDRFLACPVCDCVTSFRSGCPACGSIHTVGNRLMHHFACAHVARISEFECGSELVCPKCRLRKLVVGADFEFLDGNFQCLDCDWRGTELGVTGRCLGCELIFPMELARERDVKAYDVERMDPLAFVGTA